MTKINCCICSRRTDTNKQRTRIGTASVWPLVEMHAQKTHLDISRFSKDDYICVKCHFNISQYRMNDRGLNKKIKICRPIVFETIITKEVLRGNTVPVLDTVSNMTTDNVVLNEESPIVDAEIDDNVEPLRNVEPPTNEDTAMSISSITDSSLSHLQSMPLDEAIELSVESIIDEYVVSSVVNDLESSTNSVQNSITLQPSTSNVESQNSNSSVVTFANTQGTKSTQSKCFICDSVTGRNAVPWAAIQQVWFDKKCYIPKSNRTCSEHLNAAKKFNEESLLKIEASKESITVNINDFELWLHEVSDLPKWKPYSFDSDGIEEEKYKMLCGISKESFDDLVKYLSGMRNTETRSIRNALAMFLMLLRNNMKQEVIAHNFSTSQQVVSKTIDTVSATLEEKFVPLYLGYHHITRDEAIEKHSIQLTSNVLGQVESHVCIIADCTYNYIEKPSDFDLQRKTFSAHKKRNLLKPLYLVFPSGYILEAAGPYFCDAKNNDAANIRHHYSHSDVLLFLEEDDFFVFDRGFRDVVDETTANGQAVFMPSLLAGKRTHFTCEEANASRKYFPPLFSNKDFHDVISDVTENHYSNCNELKDEIENLGIQRMSARWEKATGNSIHDFPELSMEDLKRLTLGSYQIKIAEKYVEQHLRDDSRFGIFVHRETERIIRARIQSRFSKSKTHNTWVKFDDENNGLGSIKGYYCSCKVGERTLGCCSHVATVLRYLGHDRHQPPKVISRIRAAWDAIDCNDNDVDSSANEEDYL